MTMTNREYPKFFGSMLLKSNKENVKALVDELKKKNLEQLQDQKRHIEEQIEELIEKINKSTN